MPHGARVVEYEKAMEQLHARHPADAEAATLYALALNEAITMLGMWQESIKSNRAALAAAGSYVHAMDFMVYAHLQGAQDGAARRLVDEAAALLATQAPPAALTPTAGILAVHTAFAAIPARYAIERVGGGRRADAAAEHAGRRRHHALHPRDGSDAPAMPPPRPRTSRSWSRCATA